MANVLDSKMPAAQQEQAKKIINEFNLDNLKVQYQADKSLLVFTQDRRVVSVPTSLVDSNAWGDIRFLFRATLESPNSLWNRAAELNDWGGENFYANEDE